MKAAGRAAARPQIFVDPAPGCPLSARPFLSSNADADAGIDRAGLRAMGERWLEANPALAMDDAPLTCWAESPVLVAAAAVLADALGRAWVAVHPRWTAQERAARLAQIGPVWALESDGGEPVWRRVEPELGNAPAQERASERGNPPALERGSERGNPSALDRASEPGNAPALDRALEPTGLPSPDVAEVSLRSLGSAWILFTSGTTGTPKAVVLDAAAIASSAAAVVSVLEVGPDDAWYACMPLAHVGGLSILVRCWRSGARVVAESRFDATTMIEAMVRGGATVVSLVPTMLARLVQQGAMAPTGLRATMLGGGPVHAPVLANAVALGWSPRFSYGLTEAASTVTLERAVPEATAIQASGLAWAGAPVPGVAVRIGAPDRDGVGEIVVEGPSLLRGHLVAPGRVRLRTTAAWPTGDAGMLGADGRLRVVDRRTDLIVTGGENVYPAEVEAVLREAPGVAEACVVGVPDPVWGQQVAAVVVPQPGAAVSFEALDAWCRARLAPFRVPRIWREASELPQNALGKVQRSVVRGWFATVDAGTGQDSGGEAGRVAAVADRRMRVIR